jgi:hypothetical protein
MRQSLSVWSACALSVVLAVVALIDQVGARSLADHVTAVYAPYGKTVDPNLLYGLVYAVAGIGILLWLLVIRRRPAPVLTVVVIVVTGALGVLLLVVGEYGSRIFPPLWGILALLPAVAGLVSTPRARR